HIDRDFDRVKRALDGQNRCRNPVLQGQPLVHVRHRAIDVCYAPKKSRELFDCGFGEQRVAGSSDGVRARLYILEGVEKLGLSSPSEGSAGCQKSAKPADPSSLSLGGRPRKWLSQQAPGFAFG